MMRKKKVLEQKITILKTRIKTLHKTVNQLGKKYRELRQELEQAEALSLAYKMALDDLVLFAKVMPGYEQHPLTTKVRFVTSRETPVRVNVQVPPSLHQINVASDVTVDA